MILLDTNVLVGIVDQRDERRPRVVAELARLRERGLLVCWPVLTESLHFLKRADQREYLSGFLDTFDIGLVESVTQPSPALILDWMLQYADHKPDFVDAYLVAVSAANPRWLVWTYDSEFDRIWRRPDGSAVPMAVATKR